LKGSIPGGVDPFSFLPFAAYTSGMNKLNHAAGAAVLLLASASAFATATVSFVEIGKMTDVPHDFHKREDMQFLFREHLNLLSEKLPTGQVLKVDFLDIDLAGDEFPRVAVRDIRVLKGQADWPRMHLRYSIEQDGKIVGSGESKLSDPGYLMGTNSYSRDLYGHEKQMLDDWFRKEVLKQR
jgi:hypothetical protein